jgi:chitinase
VLNCHITSSLTFQGFTLEDPNCKTPGCPFKKVDGGGAPGPCTNTSGILSAVEIRNQIKNGATVTFDSLSASEIVTWGSDQWVSYDDAKTLKLKYVS